MRSMDLQKSAPWNIRAAIAGVRTMEPQRIPVSSHDVFFRATNREKQREEDGCQLRLWTEDANPISRVGDVERGFTLYAPHLSMMRMNPASPSRGLDHLFLSFHHELVCFGRDADVDLGFAGADLGKLAAEEEAS